MLQFFDVVAAMRSGAQISVRGTIGNVLAVEKEDGSGRRWNVRMLSNGRLVTVFWDETDDRR